MSFAPVRCTDLAQRLEALDVPLRSRANVTKSLTVGLTDCYRGISSRGRSAKEVVTADFSVGTAYQYDEQIGQGAFSVVIQAYDIVGNVYAIKKLAKEYTLLGHREAVFLRHLHQKTLRGGDFFVGLLDCYEEDGCVCLVMEMCQLTLFDFLMVSDSSRQSSSAEANILTLLAENVVRPIPQGVRQLPDENRLQTQRRGTSFIRSFRDIARRTMSALCILRSEGIFHSDIKPENIFVQRTSQSSHSQSSPEDLFSALLQDDFDVKIGDFGNAFHRSEVTKFYIDFELQSLPYRAPEVLFGVPFGDKIDVWSLGIVLLELCLGKNMFQAQTRHEQFEALTDSFGTLPPLLFAGGRFTSELLGGRTDLINQLSPKPLFSDHVAQVYKIITSCVDDAHQVPGSLFHFLASLTHPDPDQRFSAPEALQHEFLLNRMPLTAQSQRAKVYEPKNKSISALRKKLPTQYNSLNSSSIISTPSGNGEVLGKRKIAVTYMDRTIAEHKSS